MLHTTLLGAWVKVVEWFEDGDGAVPVGATGTVVAVWLDPDGLNVMISLDDGGGLHECVPYFLAVLRPADPYATVMAMAAAARGAARPDDPA